MPDVSYEKWGQKMVPGPNIKMVPGPILMPLRGAFTKNGARPQYNVPQKWCQKNGARPQYNVPIISYMKL